ncbi:hypothetical protein D3C73_1581490 [compost metagenome]
MEGARALVYSVIAILSVENSISVKVGEKAIKKMVNEDPVVIIRVLKRVKF